MDDESVLPTFDLALRTALRSANRTQAWLASELGVDPGQVSRWAHGKSRPHRDMVSSIEQTLGTQLQFAWQHPRQHELYVSAPMLGLASASFASHRAEVARFVETLRATVDGVYWPSEPTTSAQEVPASDIAAEVNLGVLVRCDALLYLQFEEVEHPTSALIELGIALGRKLATTIIVKEGLRLPYMLQSGFAGVAANSAFLPRVRLYSVADVSEADRLIARNGRGLLGLDRK